MKILSDKKILLLMNCSINLRPFLLAADYLHVRTIFGNDKFDIMLRQNYEAPLYGVDPRRLPSEFYVDYAFAADTWHGCPWCGASERVSDWGSGCHYWKCYKCLGLNCAGHDGAGRSFCACGYIAKGFQRSPHLVRGADAQQLAMAAMQVTAVAVWRR
jgi:hypothetical protein